MTYMYSGNKRTCPHTQLLATIETKSKMEKTYLIIFFVITLVSCNKSITEKQAVQKVIELCECQIDEASGVALTKNGITGEFVELTLSNSEKLSEAQHIASISALVYFENLSLEEKKDLSQINITIDYTAFKQDAIASWSFTIEELNIINNKLSLIREHINLLHRQEYQSFIDENDEQHFRYDSNQLEKNLFQQDSAFGNITNIKIIGFGFFKSTEPDSAELVNISGEVTRRSGLQKVNFTYYTDLQKNKIREFAFE